MAGLVLLVAAFGLYAWTASPVMGWLDSPEFVATSMSLGVAHSPGHPIPSLLGRAASLLPFGDVTWRVNLASAACGAAAVWALYASARVLCRRVAPALPRGTQIGLAIAAAAIYGLSWAAWGQSIRAEVYALQALLIIGAMGALIVYDDGAELRWLLLAGFLTGLGLANHHFIAAVFLVPGGIAVFARHVRRPGIRAAALTAALGILGLAAFAYLPVRSAQHPEVNWGAPHTAERFAWTVSAKAFQGAVSEDHVASRGQDAVELVVAVVQNITVPIALLVLLGFYLGVRRRGWRRLALMLGGIAAMSAAARVVIGFEPEFPDHHAYLLPAMAALVLLGTAGAAAIAQLIAVANKARARPAGIAAATALALCCAIPVAQSADARAIASAYATDDLAHWELDDVPPRSVVLLAYFQTSFRASALRTTEQSRPDLVLLDRSFLTYPGMAEEAKRRYPAMAALIDAPLRAGQPTPLPLLQQMAAKRDIRVQLHPNLEPSSYRALLPDGPFARLASSPPDEPARRNAEASDARARRALGTTLATSGRGDRIGVRDALLWHDFLRLRFYCSLGRTAAAQDAFHSAAQVSPRDHMLRRAATECGLTQAPPAAQTARE